MKNYDPNKYGFVAIRSAMEFCNAYRPWHDKVSHKTFLKSVFGKCLHYYFYFKRLQWIARPKGTAKKQIFFTLLPINSLRISKGNADKI